ncbi:hypothetical protein [Acetivibrio cellulolyticus]|uniref:hypothetical protein n=1 Tax=Acetivibrio cellulolyticus TaxID=35830 RepID=UPI0001E2D55D|nr:hypothetical protein [Acetivibrio cellulolyticus]
MFEKEILFDYKQFIIEKFQTSNMSASELCEYIAINVELKKEYSDFLSNLNKMLKNSSLKSLVSEDDSIQFCFESAKDKPQIDLIFNGFTLLQMENLDFNSITKIDISYGYSVAISYSRKKSK